MKRKKKDFIHYLGEIQVSDTIFQHAAFEQLNSIKDALKLFLDTNTDITVVEDQKILQILI